MSSPLCRATSLSPIISFIRSNAGTPVQCPLKKVVSRREKTNEMTDRFLERFKTANGSYICNDILGCDISTPEGAAFAKSHGLFTTTCCDMVASAVRILEEL